MVLDKVAELFKYINTIKDVINNDKKLCEDTKNNYSYYIKVVDEYWNEKTKIGIGFHEGKWNIKPPSSPDVIVIIRQDSFFSMLQGKETLEQIYFGGECDLWSKDGKPLLHMIGIKNLFDRINEISKKKLEQQK